MTWAVLQTVWPILTVLVYLLITSVLTVLAYMRKNEIELHRRIFESLQMRNAYTQAMRERSQANRLERR